MWTAMANGDYDSHWHAAMDSLEAKCVARGRAKSTIVFSLGWEFNGEWYPWSISVSTLQAFKDSWERIVGIIRDPSHFPGAIIDFCPARRYGGENRVLTLSQMLPPSSTFDVISRSHHDRPPFAVRTDPSTWDAHVIYGTPVTKDIGLQEIADKCRALGKKMAFSEWSVSMAGTGNDPPSEDPEYFNQKTYEFMAANADIMIWDTMFQISWASLYNRQTTTAAIKYHTLWGGS
jgi:hypothetical protein